MRNVLCIVVLAALAVVSRADVNVTGKWTGSFTVTRGDGESKDSTALLILKQSGTEITGTVGPNEDEQFAIRIGKIDGARITLEADHDGHPIKFALVLDGERITGQATMSGGDGESATAKLDVTRAK